MASLYAGVDVGFGNHHGPATAPFQYDILAFGLRDEHPQPHVFASGIRQPWQLAFAPGEPNPYVTDLGQDQDAVNPPDFILHVHAGDNYGFPS